MQIVQQEPLVEGLASRKRVYAGMRGIILENKGTRREDCFNCGYLVGKRDAANIYRYALEGKPLPR